MYKIVTTKQFPGADFEKEIIKLLHSGWKLHGTPYSCGDLHYMAQCLTRDIE
jgi:hypothetical protein